MNGYIPHQEIKIVLLWITLSLPDNKAVILNRMFKNILPYIIIILSYSFGEQLLDVIQTKNHMLHGFHDGKGNGGRKHIRKKHRIYLITANYLFHRKIVELERQPKVQR